LLWPAVETRLHVRMLTTRGYALIDSWCLDGVSGSVGDSLLRAVLELGFVGPLQVPHAGRRKHSGD
jgi:hypothetical protein